jgi:hypothetical protein
MRLSAFHPTHISHLLAVLYGRLGAKPEGVGSQNELPLSAQ